MIAGYLQQWTRNPASETLAGMVSTFALIPEVIGFSYIAGVSPSVALFSTFALARVLAFFGGRPGMISGAAGSVALVAAPLVHMHGFAYLVPATLLCGVLQILSGLCKLAILMKPASAPVIMGFVNALAILIFMAQVPQIMHAGSIGWTLIALGLAIIYLLPRFFRAIPSPLLCIAVLTALTLLGHLPVRTIGDLGHLPAGLPTLNPITAPWNLNTLTIIAIPALAMAAVGLLESLLTAQVVDRQTRTPGAPRQECIGLGLGNIAAGLSGGIAGCGMIGQTEGNLRYDGYGRLSMLVSGVFLLALLVSLHRRAVCVPVAALVAIMIMVSISTFSWSSLKALPQAPIFSSVVMLSTFITTVRSRNLALGVIIGVALDQGAKGLKRLARP